VLLKGASLAPGDSYASYPDKNIGRLPDIGRQMFMMNMPFSQHIRIGFALLRRWIPGISDSHGALLLETLIAVTVMISVATATMVGLSATQKVRTDLERQAMAENIVRNQMEYIWSFPYQTTSAQYQVTTVPSGYQVSNVQQVEELIAGNSNLQKITVTVSHDGSELLVLETYRTNELSYDSQ